LVIRGIVYDQDCTPVPGFAMTMYQTDAAGAYGPGHGTDAMQCCYYQGRVTTGEDGSFEIMTVMPGHYQGESTPPPAHIHVEFQHPVLSMPGTEFVFPGDPYLDNPQLSGYTPVALEQRSDEAGSYLFGIAEILVQLPETETNRQDEGENDLRTFAVEPGSSQVSYHIREEFADIASMVTAVGSTGAVTGEIQLDGDNLPLLEGFTISVDLRGLRTDDPMRDEKLADQWLVTNEYPYATFTATHFNGLESVDEGYEVALQLTGDMTIRDTTRPVTFSVNALLDGGVITASGEAVIRMTDFGITPPNLFGFVKVEDEVKITVDLVAREAAGI
jgi:polyisoprenoid-binding protein YceI